MVKILYISRDGLLEPLGQSQILSYLEEIRDRKFFILSFEKEETLEEKGQLDFIKGKCADLGITWKYLKYTKGVRSLSIVYDFIRLFLHGLNIIFRQRIDIVHARSYYPGFIALFFKVLFGVRYVFDMRALWVNELIQSKRIKERSLTLLLVRALERKTLEKADSIISLTNAALPYIDQHILAVSHKCVIIPTCVNLERFKQKKVDKYKDEIVIGCTGSFLSGWFDLQLFTNCVECLLRLDKRIKVLIVSRESATALTQIFSGRNVDSRRITITKSNHEEMPELLETLDGTIFFYKADSAKLGSSPTRLGESLSVGLPVLTGSGIGDVDRIIKDNNVGVIIESNTEIELACNNYLDLLKDREVSNRCRQVANEIYNVEKGAEIYNKVYEDLS